MSRKDHQIRILKVHSLKENGGKQWTPVKIASRRTKFESGKTELLFVPVKSKHFEYN